MKCITLAMIPTGNPDGSRRPLRFKVALDGDPDSNVAPLRPGEVVQVSDQYADWITGKVPDFVTITEEMPNRALDTRLTLAQEMGTEHIPTEAEKAAAADQGPPPIAKDKPKRKAPPKKAPAQAA